MRLKLGTKKDFSLLGTVVKKIYSEIILFLRCDFFVYDEFSIKILLNDLDGKYEEKAFLYSFIS
jgi:hypothetical protein